MSHQSKDFLCLVDCAKSEIKECENDLSSVVVASQFHFPQYNFLLSVIIIIIVQTITLFMNSSPLLPLIKRFSLCIPLCVLHYCVARELLTWDISSLGLRMSRKRRKDEQRQMQPAKRRVKWRWWRCEHSDEDDDDDDEGENNKMQSRIIPRPLNLYQNANFVHKLYALQPNGRLMDTVEKRSEEELCTWCRTDTAVETTDDFLSVRTKEKLQNKKTGRELSINKWVCWCTKT